MYELVFWQYQEGFYLNHHLVYESLVEQEMVEGLEELPVAVILNRIGSVFSSWEKVDDSSWKNPNGKGAFQVKTTSQSIQIDCYGTEGKTMELLAATMEEFKCPCYDPQVPVRFDEMNELGQKMHPNYTFSDQMILEDDLVLLRPLSLSDVENLSDISENEPETWEYSLVRADGKTNLENYIQLALEAKAKGTEFPFIVFDKKSCKYAGSTRFYDINFNFKTLQLGYTWYGKDFRGTGLNKHCKFLLLQFAFETLGMERVEFRADNNNIRSIAAMKSIGCTVEGVLRNHMPINNSTIRRDSIILSILKTEWKTDVKNNLKEKL